MDVGDWLRSFGLERYEQAFRDNEIDVDLLPNLTGDDLKDLGVSLVGHRRRLLDAIARLRDTTSVSQVTTPERAIEPTVAAEPSADHSGRSSLRSEAERRQLTVLFCDLVGSTALAGQLDPEDLREVIRAYQDACTRVITRYEGHVAKFMGDGVLAYFGYPRAHEDDAERAVRAALELNEAVGRLTADEGRALAARIGIATGQVVVGELIGEGAAQEQAVVGETPNLAARLQTLAAPGNVVISQSTRRLLGGLFELADLGPMRVKGFAEPLAAWRVEGEGRAEGRFEALHGERLTALIGREHELGILLERWSWVKDGDGQVVLLSGEPGIGKSRLTRSLIEHLIDEPHTRLRYYCSPYHTNSALYPVIKQLELAAGFVADDAAEAKLDKLEAVLADATENLAEVVPLIAALVSIAAEPRYPPVNLTPEAQKLRTFEALLGQVVGLADRRPIFMVLEDAHWLDPTSIELFGLVIDRIQHLPVLLLITFRPGLTLPWSGYAHVTSLTLSRLGQRQGTQMVEHLTGSKPLPAEVLQQILLKTDGVPLFVEELTKAVLESGLLADAGDRWELSGPLPPLAIPTTLHDSLMARLDRLAPVKEVAQIGAVIGREFSHELLTAASPLLKEKLGEALDQLVASELIFRRGTPPEASYSFKHALVQDAAYQSLLKSRRQQLHARIAQTLEERFPDVGQSQPEVLARHLTEAGLAERAVAYWRRAGELAAGRSANLEAIAHLSKGLELIATLPDAPEHLSEELALLLAIGGPLMANKGFAAPEVERTYSRASALCEQLGRSDELFPVLKGLWGCYLVRGEYQRVYDLAERLVALAEELGVPLQRALARRARGTALFFLGRFTDATGALDDGIAIDDAVAAWDDPAHLLHYTVRAGAACRLYSAWALWYLGFPDLALQKVEAGLALAQRLAHASGLAFALVWAAALHILRREFDLAYRRAEPAVEITRKHRMSAWFGHATVCRGFALAGLGQKREGIAQIQTGLAAWHVTGARLLDTQWRGFLAEAHLQAGQFAASLDVLDRAAEVAAETGECHYQAEMYRLRGSVLAETGEAAEGESWFQRAIDTARSQQAKSLELRAATSLARLWGEQGRPNEARDLLAPVYGWFTEGFDTPDLKDAKVLLEQLR